MLKLTLRSLVPAVDFFPVVIYEANNQKLDDIYNYTSVFFLRAVFLCLS